LPLIKSIGVSMASLSKSLFLALPKAAGRLARDAHDATCLTV
jgi:hypothetical protein